MPSDDESKNPFVRFKQHVDYNISSGLQGVLGLPSLVTQNFNVGPLRSEEADAEGAGRDRYGNRFPDSHASSSSGRPAGSSGGGNGNPRRDSQDHQSDWQVLAYGSRYSPLVLAKLPDQPCPRDLPDWMDPSMFTYVDAFEDLLAASSGRPMMSLEKRYEWNQMLATLYPRGEHPLSWFSRLESQDLLEAFHRYSSVKGIPYSERSDTWRCGYPSEEAEKGKLDWPDAHEAGHEQRETPRRGEGFGLESGFFGELDKVMKELGKVLEDEFAAFGERRRSREERSKNEEEGENRGRKTEVDLYDAVESAYQDAGRSLSTFIKSFTEGRWRPAPWGDDDMRSNENFNAPSEEVREDESGKTVRSTKEYVDAFGNRHIKTEVRRTSWDGNEVSTETHYSVQPVERRTQMREALPEKSPSKESQEVGGASRPEKGEDKPGWFWK